MVISMCENPRFFMSKFWFVVQMKFIKQTKKMTKNSFKTDF